MPRVHGRGNGLAFKPFGRNEHMRLQVQTRPAAPGTLSLKGRPRRPPRSTPLYLLRHLRQRRAQIRPLRHGHRRQVHPRREDLLAARAKASALALFGAIAHDSGGRSASSLTSPGCTGRQDTVLLRSPVLMKWRTTSFNSSKRRILRAPTGVGVPPH